MVIDYIKVMMPCYWQYEKIYLEEHSTSLSVAKDEVLLTNLPPLNPLNSDSKQSILLTVNNRGRTLAMVAGNNPISSRDMVESNPRLKHMISV